MSRNDPPFLQPITSRYYKDIQDLLQIQVMLMKARAQTDDWRYAHIGEFLFNYFMIACHLDPQEHIRLWHAGDQLVGFALLGEDPALDFQILPEYEWRGIEEEAMQWAETRIAELRELDPTQWGGSCVSGSRQDNPERIAFLENHGFQPGGEFSEVNMIRSLDEPIPEAVVLPGCQVRALSEEEDIPSRAEAHREVWQPWTVGNVSDDEYANFMRLPGYHRDLDVVLVAPDGIIAAFVNGWVDFTNQIGDFGPVGARPAYRRQGYTRAALLEGLRRMKERGMQRVCVSTGVSNTPAIRLYESVGFKIVNRYLEYVKTR